MRFRNSCDVEKEMKEMEEEYEKESCGEKIGVWRLLYMVVFEKPHWRKPLLISCTLCFGLQMSGINVVSYSSEVSV